MASGWVFSSDVTRRLRRVAVGLVAAGGLLVACQSSDDDAGQSGILEIAVAADPANTLQASVTVTGETSGPVELRIESDGLSTRTVTSSEAADSHRFNVVALRAETDYRFTAVDQDGAESPVLTFTTGALPATAPEMEIAQSSVDPATDGVTFVGLRSGQGGSVDGPTYFGFDSEGHVVWYLDTDNQTSGDPYLRHLGNGEILVMFTGLIEHMTLDGRVLASYDMSQANGWHHDVQLLDNGNLLVLGRENQTVNGDELSGDVVFEVDPSGNTVWEWSTFDHLDVTRFPGELSTSETRAGGLDWTHGNSVRLDEASGQLLLSLRSQSWVVNIDRESGDINWIAGDDGHTDPGFDADFLTLESGTWATAQHAAMFTEAGELLIYDNRNESGGETELSRSVIYEINAEAGTASQVFEASANKYTPSLGDVDELANGNVFMTAGGGQDDQDARLIEVDRNGETVWEAVVADNLFYRSERIAWLDVDAGAAVSEDTTSEVAATETAEPETTGQGNQANRNGNGNGNGNGQDGNGQAQAGDGNGQAQAGDGNGQAQAGDAIPANEPSEEPSTDITDAILTSTDINCAAYAGRYTSEVTDQLLDTEHIGNTNITVDGDVCILETDSIPNHDFGEGGRFSNGAGEVAGTYLIPTSPQLNDEPTPLQESAHAVLLNGVGWHAYPAACFAEGDNDNNLGQEAIGCAVQVDHPWRYNIGSPLNNRFAVDIFFAHTQNGGFYHYHQTPSVLYEVDCSGVAESPVIGFARDGFPVFGPCFTDESGTVRAAESSYDIKQGSREDIGEFTTPYVVGDVASEEYDGQFIGDYEFIDGTGDLDQCNGMTVDGSYGYYLTADYPYVLGCFSGTPTDTFGRTD